MLPTLCGIIAAPQQHSSILVDGAVELVTLALAPSGPEAAQRIHAAATPAMLQVRWARDVGGGAGVGWWGGGGGGGAGGGPRDGGRGLMRYRVWATACDLPASRHEPGSMCYLCGISGFQPNHRAPPPPSNLLQLVMHHDDGEVLRSATAYLRTLLQVRGRAVCAGAPCQLPRLGRDAGR